MIPASNLYLQTVSSAQNQRATTNVLTRNTEEGEGEEAL